MIIKSQNVYKRSIQCSNIIKKKKEIVQKLNKILYKNSISSSISNNKYILQNSIMNNIYNKYVQCRGIHMEPIYEKGNTINILKTKQKQQYTQQIKLSEITNSVIKIYVNLSSTNYELPWQNKPSTTSIGSGFIIDDRYIITNAHVIADAMQIMVKKPNSFKKYTAYVYAAGHECDLALLRVDNEEFWQEIQVVDEEVDTNINNNKTNELKPLVFSKEIPSLQDIVVTVGYPIGGDNLCLTQGVVSRVEPVYYAHTGTNLLAIQIDAAINPGNSGGPALVDDKVVGVAFQNIQNASSVSYIIPVPIIKHFLDDVSNGGYRIIDRGNLRIKYENELLQHKLSQYKNTFRELVNNYNITYDSLANMNVLSITGDNKNISNTTVDINSKITTTIQDIEQGEESIIYNKNNYKFSSKDMISNNCNDNDDDNDNDNYDVNEDDNNKISDKKDLLSTRSFCSQGIVCQEIYNQSMQYFLGMLPESREYLYDERIYTDVSNQYQGSTNSNILPAAILHFPEMNTIKENYNTKNIKKDLQDETFVGVVINSIHHLSPCYNILQRNDVLLAIDGNPIASDGTIHFRNNERIGFDYLISLKYIHDTVRITYLRRIDDSHDNSNTNLIEKYKTKYKYVIKEIDITLRSIPSLVRSHGYDDIASYYVLLGIVFTPLTMAFLKVFGTNWYNNAPRSLVTLASNSPSNILFPNHEIVLITQILPDDTTIGYTNIQDVQVCCINGIYIKNIKHLKYLLEYFLLRAAIVYEIKKLQIDTINAITWDHFIDNLQFSNDSPYRDFLQSQKQVPYISSIDEDNILKEYYSKKNIISSNILESHFYSDPNNLIIELEDTKILVFDLASSISRQKIILDKNNIYNYCSHDLLESGK